MGYDILLKHKFQNLLPPLRIHTWGGFGSQLFAAHVIIRCRERFPGRKILVINHSSGVTRRIKEVDFESLDIPVIQKDDFRLEQGRLISSLTPKHTFGRLFISMKNLTVQVLKMLRFVQDANDESSLNSITFWTMELRGHYTNLRLKRDSITQLYSVILNSIDVPKLSEVSIVVHYRLGDLLTLENKCPIEPERVDKVLGSVLTDNVFLTILTDSPSLKFAQFVSNTKLLCKYQAINRSPIETLGQCVSADYFIGTTAKISLWSAIFRQFIFCQPSALPKELEWAKNCGLEATWY